MITRVADIFVGLAYLVFSAIYCFYLTPNFVAEPLRPEEGATISYALQPELLAYISGGILAILGIVLFTQGLRSHSVSPIDINKTGFLKISTVVVLTYIYIKVLPLVGFLTASPFFIAIFMVMLGIRHWKYLLAFSLILPFAMHYFFFYSFHIILPEGALWT